MTLQVIFMDAGQGDCALIVYPDNSLTLVDCGSTKNKDMVSTEIEQVLTRYLKVSNNKLKALVLTHPDGDHYNLVEDLIVAKKVQVGTVFHGGVAQDFAKGLLSYFPPSTIVSFSKGYGNLDVVPALSYKGAYPSADVRILAANIGNPNIKKDANPNSIVLLITYSNFNIFLMGDSTALTETFIYTKLNLSNLLKGRRTILKVGHHGSATSSTDNWLNLITPELAFISSDTREFGGGVSLPRSGIVDRILAGKKLKTLDDAYKHKYVQYNDGTKRHEDIETTRAIFTTLHLLKFDKDKINFESYGTSWYFWVDDDGDDNVVPACDWSDIDKAY